MLMVLHAEFPLSMLYNSRDLCVYTDKIKADMVKSILRPIWQHCELFSGHAVASQRGRRGQSESLSCEANA